MEVEAMWNGEEYFTPVESGVLWRSPCGDCWRDARTGEPCDSPEFEAARIALAGGPRDGVTVS